MGTSLDHHFRWSTASVPAQLKCLFVVDNAELNVKRFLALIKIFTTGPIHQTAGMIIVKGRYQPPMQLSHAGSYHSKPLFGVRTTYIVLINAIQGAMHLLLLKSQPDSSWRYMSNTIDFNAFNLF